MNEEGGEMGAAVWLMGAGWERIPLWRRVREPLCRSSSGQPEQLPGAAQLLMAPAKNKLGRLGRLPMLVHILLRRRQRVYL